MTSAGPAVGPPEPPASARARRRERPPGRRGARTVLVVLAVTAVVLAGGALAQRLGANAEDGPIASSPAASSGPVATATPVAPPEAGRDLPPSSAPADPADPEEAASPVPVDAGAAEGSDAAVAGSPDVVPVPGPAAPVARSDAPAPVSLRVPAIDVDLSSLVRLGVDDEGAIEVPADPDDAGWLTASATPGRTGPAVIAGHVDTREGPAVFARLSELVEGDEVSVGLADGTDVTYVVTGAQTYPKTEFPTDLVYGPAPAPVLRLVTCGGEFDRTVSSYEDNVVVYAVLAG